MTALHFRGSITLLCVWKRLSKVRQKWFHRQPRRTHTHACGTTTMVLLHTLRLSCVAFFCAVVRQTSSAAAAFFSSGFISRTPITPLDSWPIIEEEEKKTRTQHKFFRSCLRTARFPFISVSLSFYYNNNYYLNHQPCLSVKPTLDNLDLNSVEETSLLTLS